jgi:hypothetical protein
MLRGMLRGMLLRISEAWGEGRNLVRNSAIGAVMPRAGPAIGLSSAVKSGENKSL